jgi:N-acetylglucosaminyl-diphospho-decaprenol L-rhamnosyltransferase
MDLSIIIVNWNSIAFTRDCIASLRTAMQGQKYEIIIVDNASQDDCSCLLSDASVPVKVINSPSNLGFAGANNLGFEHSKGDKLLFLNPDTLVKEDAIQKMAAHLQSRSEVGAVGCRLLNRDFTVQTSSVQPFPTIWNQLFALEWIQRRWPGWSLLGIQSLFSKSSDSSDVEVVSGACIMIKRDVFATVGGFSTEYFLYAEEADLCCRIRRAGWRINHVPNAQIVHFGGEATKQNGNTFCDVVMRQSVFKLLRTFRGSAYAYLYRIAIFCSAAMRLAALVALSALPASVLDRTVVIKARRKWRSIASWAIAMEGWSRDLAEPSTLSAKASMHSRDI